MQYTGCTSHRGCSGGSALAHEAVGAGAHGRQAARAVAIAAAEGIRLHHAQPHLLQAAPRQRVHRLKQRRCLLHRSPFAPDRPDACAGAAAGQCWAERRAPSVCHADFLWKPNSSNLAALETNSWQALKYLNSEETKNAVPPWMAFCAQTLLR